MSYTITLSNGNTIATILDGTADTSHTSLTLVGRNYSNYGQIMVDNLVGLLENFARNVSPQNPLTGQIWYDTTGTGTLKVWTGTTWQNLGGALTTSATDVASYTPLPAEPIVEGLLRYNKTLNVMQVQAGGMWRNTHDGSSLAATGQYGPTQDPTTTTLTDLRGVNYPVKWSPTLWTTDVTGEVAFGGYTFSDATNDLGGINLTRVNQNGGSPFNARFGGIHAMNVKVYSSVAPGVKQVDDPAEVSVGTASYPFDAAYVGNVTVLKSVTPQYANVVIGSAGHAFSAVYTNGLFLGSNVTATSSSVTIGDTTTPIQSYVGTNATITNVSSSNISTANITITGTGITGSASIMPNATKKYNIGSSSLQFGNLWADTGNFNNINYRGTPWLDVIKGANTMPWSALYSIPSTLYGMGITEVPWAMITGAPVTAPPGFDIPFAAGFNPDFSQAKLKMQPYGQLILARDILIENSFGFLQTAAVGADVIVDVLRNGSSIYTTRPFIAAGNQMMNSGALNNTQKYCNVGDILQFVVVQIGTTTPGSGLSFTLKGRER
jgi:hypothetical protein